MTTSNATWTEAAVQVAGLRVQYLEAGAGAGTPLLVLHRSTGNPGWLPFHQELSGGGRTVVPDLPGYGQSERPDWAREPRDLAILLHRALDHIGLDRVSVVGLGFGGWVAAEMAVLQQQRFERLVLVGAPGIRPDEGEILDQMMMAFEVYVRACFADQSAFEAEFGEQPDAPTRELWDFSREMTARLTWKPYMWDWRLPYLLPEVRTPALLVWGDEDGVVPRSVARQYRDALADARLEVVDGAGHMVEVERPSELAALVRAFVS
ncbi:MAG: alpha/beta hydrolase [Chloroflexi bacterium]|nr:alpha/beta hydrolase [Chloroflexota bacterium]